MEFVVVAPLYFLLLGGLFYIGEFALNRVRINVGDQLLTWSVATRFCQDKGGIKQLLTGWLFGDTLEYALLTVNDASQTVGGNAFCSAYVGGIERIEIGMPSWANGMMNMRKAVSGETLAATDLQTRFSYFDDADMSIRTVVMHRIKDFPDEYDRSKNIRACDLMPRNYLVNVFVDSWIHSGGWQKETSPIENVRGGEVVRALIQWGE